MHLTKGAEAELTKEEGIVVKERIKKGYRLAVLDDKLRKRRTATEAKLLREARRVGVLTPQILEEDRTTIKMEFIRGKKVKDILSKSNLKGICKEIGRNIALLHSYDIIHGDLTTSNMLIKDGKIWFIDFGLGFISRREEDKAVDLYLLREALESTHFQIIENAWKAILEAYKSHYPDSNKVIKALSKVEKRGRYKER